MIKQILRVEWFNRIPKSFGRRHVILSINDGVGE